MNQPQEDAIRTLRDGGMPASLLAEILRVERRTVYALLDDPAADHPCRARAAAILGAIRDGTEHGIRGVVRVREQRPAGGGDNLREVLSRDVFDTEAVVAKLGDIGRSMAHYARMEAARRDGPSGRGGNPILDEMAWVGTRAP